MRANCFIATIAYYNTTNKWGDERRNLVNEKLIFRSTAALTKQDEE